MAATAELDLSRAKAAPGWVLVKKLEFSNRTAGGLYMPDDAKDSKGVLQLGLVIDAAEHCDDKSVLTLQRGWLKAGAKVLYTGLNRWGVIPGHADAYVMVKSWEIVVVLSSPDKD